MARISNIEGWSGTITLSARSSARSSRLPCSPAGVSITAYSRPRGGLAGAFGSSAQASMTGSVAGRSASQPCEDCCRSRSASATQAPCAAKYPARLVDSVLLPTPPFGFATTITVMYTPGKPRGAGRRRHGKLRIQGAMISAKCPAPERGRRDHGRMGGYRRVVPARGPGWTDRSAGETGPGLVADGRERAWRRVPAFDGAEPVTAGTGAGAWRRGRRGPLKGRVARRGIDGRKRAVAIPPRRSPAPRRLLRPRAARRPWPPRGCRRAHRRPRRPAPAPPARPPRRPDIPSRHAANRSRSRSGNACAPRRA